MPWESLSISMVSYPISFAHVVIESLVGNILHTHISIHPSHNAFHFPFTVYPSIHNPSYRMSLKLNSSRKSHFSQLLPLLHLLGIFTVDVLHHLGELRACGIVELFFGRAQDLVEDWEELRGQGEDCRLGGGICLCKALVTCFGIV